MSECVLVGEAASSPHTVFELRIWDHLTHIEPSLFNLDDVPTLNPADYYITSGDAIAKTNQLIKDLDILLSKLKPTTCGSSDQKQDGFKCACGKTCISKSGMTLHKRLCTLCLSQVKSGAYAAYRKAVAGCLINAKILVSKLLDARGPHLFLETEHIDHRLMLVGKDPRKRDIE